MHVAVPLSGTWSHMIYMCRTLIKSWLTSSPYPMRPGHRPDESHSTCDPRRWCRVTPQKELLHIHTGQCSCRRMLTMGFTDASVCDRQPTLRWCDMGHTGCMGGLVTSWTICGVMAGHRSLGKPDASETVQGWNATGRWIPWGTCLS